MHRLDKISLHSLLYEVMCNFVSLAYHNIFIYYALYKKI